MLAGEERSKIYAGLDIIDDVDEAVDWWNKIIASLGSPFEYLAGILGLNSNLSPLLCIWRRALYFALTDSRHLQYVRFPEI